MATFDATHINSNGAFELTEKSALVKSFRDTYADIASTAGTAFTPTAAPANLTDSSGGTPASTLAAVPAVAIASAGGNTYADATVNTAVNLAVTPVKNDIASLNAQINAIKTALVASGILT